MRPWRFFLIGCGLVYLAAPTAFAQHEHAPVKGEPERLGNVEFATSCDPAVKAGFNRAMALLHSFWYEAAETAFTDVARRDPSCAMAWWGVAMTRWHPHWAPPGPEGLKAGAAAVDKAKTAGAKTERERGYIGVIAEFYRDYATRDHRTRVLAYEAAMEQQFAKYPEDDEAALLYSLALQGAAVSVPPDPSYARQKKAGEIAERVFAAHPDHPGAAHYVIHAYDYPPLAEKALAAARQYAKIAADSPHALHMPSHIFTRMGYWEESVTSNLDSAASGRKHGAPGDELHALDYLEYAYLQLGQDEKARAVLAQAPRRTGAAGSTYFAGLYSLASMSARYTLERREWANAAALELPTDVFPGGRLAWTEISLHFARGLGSARSGDLVKARAAIERLAEIREAVAQVSYWPNAAEAHRQSVAAWVALAEGKKEEAIELMRSAAELEDRIDKHPVMPGYVLPARELYGDMLLELGQAEQALAEYEATLRSSPGRFNAIHGAAFAAERAGKPEKARVYYAQLVKLAGNGDGRRAEFRRAKQFLEQAAAQKQ